MLSSVFSNIKSFCEGRYPYFIIMLFLCGAFLGVYFSRFLPGRELYLDTDVIVASDSSEGPSILVDISGAVIKPGLYTLPSGARVGELLRLTQGVSTYADVSWVSKNINKASILEDGQKLYIPYIWDASFFCDKEISPLIPSSSLNPVDASSLPLSNLVNLNEASLDELDSLPGIGVTYANKIISNRPYSDIADFSEKINLSTSVLEKIKNLVSF